MTVTAVLFDLGGTVCRFQPQVRMETLAADSALSPDQIQQVLWGSGFDAECDVGRFAPSEIYRHVRAELGLRVSYQAFCTTWASAFEPESAVIAVANAFAHRAQLALLTNNGPVLLDILPNAFPQIVDTFHPLLFSCELGALKPSVAAFQAALRRLDTTPEETAIVDNSLDVIKTACHLGLPALHFTSAETLRLGLGRLLSSD